MVHRLQRDKGKEDCTVFGLAADDRSFCFMKINNDSQVRKYTNQGYYLALTIDMTAVVHATSSHGWPGIRGNFWHACIFHAQNLTGVAFASERSIEPEP